MTNQFKEVVLQQIGVEFDEATRKPRRIFGTGLTADEVNRNGRRYPKESVQQAINRLVEAGHQLVGRIEHGDADASNVDIVWEAPKFDGKMVQLEGKIAQTRAGKDLTERIKAGMRFGISQVAMGKSRKLPAPSNNGEIEEVYEFDIQRYDIVWHNSDPNGRVSRMESTTGNTVIEQYSLDLDNEEEMKTENKDLKVQTVADSTPPPDINALLKDNPEIVARIKQEAIEAQQAKLEAQRLEEAAKQAELEAERQAAEARLREAAGIGEDEDLEEMLKRQREERQQLAEAKRQSEIKTKVEELVTGTGYPEAVRTAMTEAILSLEPADIAAVDKLFASKQKEYQAIMAKNILESKGYTGPALQVAPVIEVETGQPEYTAISHKLTESIIMAGGSDWNYQKPMTRSQRYAKKYMERFDQLYKHHLVREHREFSEAETTTDLNLPYSVIRSVMMQALPTLVATEVFDVDVITSSVTQIYTEEYAGETGYAVTITDEAITASDDTWQDLAGARVQFGTVVADNGAGTTYVEGTDYLINYELGKIMTLADGAIADAAAIEVDYVYNAVRKGEMQPIERGKGTLTAHVITAAADRLSTQLTSEAVSFSASQLGYDAVTRTLTMLVSEVRRLIDEGLMYEALTAVLGLANNNAGAWDVSADTTETIADGVAKIGLASVKVANRYYMPTGILMSVSNGDRISNWDGFTAAGARADSELNANGYLGRLKGLPVYQSPVFTDAYILVVNRELVMHRVYQPMRLDGPHQAYDATTGKLIAAKDYYVEEYNATIAPIPGKGSYITLTLV